MTMTHADIVNVLCAFSTPDEQANQLAAALPRPLTRLGEPLTAAETHEYFVQSIVAIGTRGQCTVEKTAARLAANF